MPRWFLFSAVAGLSWAVWAILSKAVESAHLSIAQTQLLFTGGLLPAAAVALLRRPPPARAMFSRGSVFALLAGFLGALGNLAFYGALAEGGRAAIVIPLTALYPLVTLAVARLFMRERVNGIQTAGVVVAVVGAVLLSGEALSLVRTTDAGVTLQPARWMVYSLGALAAWGLLSAAQKVATNAITPELSFAWFALAFVPVTAAVVVISDLSGPIAAQPLWFGLVAGLMNGVGVLASFAAYRSDGKASVVTSLAGVLSSVFTVALAVALLRETLDGAEAAGIALAVAAAAALSYEKRPVAA